MPSGTATRLFVAPTPILMVILSGCGCENSEVKAGIDKRPCRPKAMILKAVLAAILPMSDRWNKIQAVAEWEAQSF